MTNNTNTTPATEPEFTVTNEQRTLAAQLNERVKTLETQGSIAVFAQARDLREIMTQQLFKAIETPSGGTYSTFGQYILAVTTKSPATISQNISVVTTFSEYSDERLAAAGPEKLDIARKMMAEGHYATTDEALQAAIRHSRADLLDIRKSKGSSAIPTVPLSTRRVVKALSTRFEEGFEKFSAIYRQVHNDPNNMPTDSQVTEFYLDVVNGLPNDFLLEAAAGQGGAAPEMADGFTPKDVPVADVVYYIAEQLASAGRDPDEILDELREGVQSIQDRFEVQKRERDEQEKAKIKAEKEAAKEAEKAEKAQAKEIEKMTKLLGTVGTGYVLTLKDGSVGEVVDVSADGNQLMIKATNDTAGESFSDTEQPYAISDLATAGVASAKKPAKPAKVAAKVEEPAPTLGISKAQQVGKKAKAPKKAAAKAEE